MEILFSLLTIISLLFTVVSSFIISIGNDVYDIETCLSDKKEFLKCVFMFQVALYMMTEQDINTVGIIILEIIITILTWYGSIFMFIILVAGLFVKIFVKLFIFCFRKKENREING